MKPSKNEYTQLNEILKLEIELKEYVLNLTN